jgi:hypothetical protein
MIDYTAKKRFYTDGQVFNYLSGGSYTGYVSVLSGVAYEDTTLIPLLPTTTFECNYLLSKYFKDRSVDEVVSLPYSSEDILLGANDFLTQGLFLDKLRKLHDNNTYVYSRMFMPNNDLPVKLLSGGDVMDYSYACIPNSNSLNLTAVSTLVQSVPFATSSIKSIRELGNVRRFAARLKDDTPTDYTVFAITSAGFMTLSGNKAECQILESFSPFIESEENALTFGSLYDITLSRGNAFITDQGNSVIYKIDVSGYFNGDLALANKRNLIEILGGDGPQGSKNLFKSPKHITSSDDIIVINDSGNAVLKVFDTNFNFLTRITSIPLLREPVEALQINKLFNTLYVFTRETISRKVNLYIIDLQCYRILESYKEIALPLQNTESINNIEFSKTTSDYYYVCTDRAVYKLFVNKPKVLIGQYQNLQLDYVTGTKVIQDGDGPDTVTNETIPSNQWRLIISPFIGATWNWGAKNDKIFIDTDEETSIDEVEISILTPFNDVYKGISFLPTSFGYDSVVFITDGRVYFYNETNIFKQVIKTDKLQAFGGANMTLNSEEYIQASTINKELYKVVHDILTLKNNLLGRFTGYFDPSNIFTLTDYNYNIDLSSFELGAVQDYYIHENEKSILGVINRVLSNIFDLQVKLVNLTSIDYGNSVKRELIITPNNSALRIS